MSEEEAVLQAVREALAKSPRRPRPEGDPAALIASRRLDGESLRECFVRNFTAVRGRVAGSVEELREWLSAQGFVRGYCDPLLRENVGRHLEGVLDVEYAFSHERVDDYSFGITRASGAIAETGTLVLTDADTPCRLAALAPWVHVAILDGESLYRDVAAALATLGDDPNVIWVTGPSKTADIEGILIEGVHGPGEQVCLWV